MVPFAGLGPSMTWRFVGHGCGTGLVSQARRPARGEGGEYKPMKTMAWTGLCTCWRSVSSSVFELVHRDPRTRAYDGPAPGRPRNSSRQPMSDVRSAGRRPILRASFPVAVLSTQGPKARRGLGSPSPRRGLGPGLPPTGHFKFLGLLATPTLELRLLQLTCPSSSSSWLASSKSSMGLRYSSFLFDLSLNSSSLSCLFRPPLSLASILSNLSLESSNIRSISMLIVTSYQNSIHKNTENILQIFTMSIDQTRKWRLCWKFDRCGDQSSQHSISQDADRTPDSKKAYDDFVAGLELINQQEEVTKEHTGEQNKKHMHEKKQAAAAAKWERLIKQRKNATHGMPYRDSTCQTGSMYMFT